MKACLLIPNTHLYSRPSPKPIPLSPASSSALRHVPTALSYIPWPNNDSPDQLGISSSLPCVAHGCCFPKPMQHFRIAEELSQVLLDTSILNSLLSNIQSSQCSFLQRLPHCSRYGISISPGTIAVLDAAASRGKVLSFRIIMHHRQFSVTMMAFNVNTAILLHVYQRWSALSVAATSIDDPKNIHELKPP